MKITVSVSAVDGQHYFAFHTDKAVEALKFLEEYDHEGSNVGVAVTGTTTAEDYDLLVLLSTYDSTPEA